MFTKFTAFLLSMVLCFSLVACGGPTVSAYITTIGAGVDAIIAIEAPNWTGTAALNSAFNAAEVAATNWKAGTPGTEAIEALNVLASNIDAIPLGTKNDELIAAAVSAVDGLIALIQSQSSTTTASSQEVMFAGWLSTGNPTTSRKHVYTGKPIKSQKDFKKVWNKTAPKSAKV